MAAGVVVVFDLRFADQDGAKVYLIGSKRAALDGLFHGASRGNCGVI